MLIFDFDQTLYDTAGLVRAIKEVFASYGFDETVFDTTYKQARVTDESERALDYSFERHAEMLSRDGYDVDRVAMLRDLHACVSDAFVLPGVAEMLRNLLQKKEKLILLSAGNPNFQYQKVVASGLEMYFDTCIYIAGDKVLEVEKIIEKVDEVVYFINDKLQENIAVHQAFPQVRVITVYNAEKDTLVDVQNSGIPYVMNITDVINSKKND